MRKLVLLMLMLMMITSCSKPVPPPNPPAVPAALPLPMSYEVPPYVVPKKPVRYIFKPGTKVETPFGCEQGRIRGVDC